MNCKKFAKDLYFLPKWRNFAESGHTGSKPVFRKAKAKIKFLKNLFNLFHSKSSKVNCSEHRHGFFGAYFPMLLSYSV